MRNLNTLLLLAIATVGIVLATIFYQPDTSVEQMNAGPLLPGLDKKLDTAQVITVLHAGETVTLNRSNKTWVVVEKANYPAMSEQVKDLLLGLAYAQRIEPKTSNPENYAALGLADPEKSGSDASKVEIKAQNGQFIAKVTLGKRRAGTETAAAQSNFYALVDGSPQTWLVSGNVPTIGAPGAWLRRNLLELERSRIQEVLLKHKDGEVIRLIPKITGQGSAIRDNSLTVDGLKPAETLQNDYIVDDIADRFALMQLEDVRPRSLLKWPEKSDLVIEVQSNDGLLITLNAAKIDEQPWIYLSAEAKPNTTHATAKPQSSPESADPKTAQKTPGQEAAALNARWQGWAYTLADWAYQALDKHRVDLIKPIAPTPTTPPASNQPPQDGADPVSAPGTSAEPAETTDPGAETAIEPLPDDMLDTTAMPPADAILRADKPPATPDAH